MADFKHLKVGDHVTRMLAGVVKVELVVGKIDEEFIYCSSADGIISLEEGWKFRISNGAEVDEALGWDGLKLTGSYLLK